MREGAAPVVVRVQQQQEDMRMAGMAYRLTATLSADALGEGVVARQDGHVAGGHDDTHALSPQPGNVNHTVMCGCLRDGMRIGVAGRIQW